MRYLKLLGLLAITDMAFIAARFAGAVCHLAERVANWAERTATRVCE